MDTSLTPWEHNPDLIPERLTFVAQLIANTRLEALDEHNPTKGDGAWSYGCRCHERCKNVFLEKTIQGDIPWLSVAPTSNLKFQLKIGETIIHLYRGSPDAITPRASAKARAGINQLAFPFDNDINTSFLWYFAIETLHDGEVVSISCVGAIASGQVICKWAAPLKPFIPAIGIVDAPIAEAVEQQAPTVSIPDNFIEKVLADE